MYLIWHGTASIEIVGGEGRILFDPFVPLKGSNVDVDIAEYDGFTDIFVTHGHVDHISDIPRIVKRTPNVHVYCTRTPWNTLRNKGVPRENMTCIAYGDILHVKGFTITALHGRHAVLPRLTKERLMSWIHSPFRKNIIHLFKENLVCKENDETVFYLVEAEGKTIAVMGSLNLREDVEYPRNMDLLVLPYNGWEDNYPPAIEVIERLKPKKVMLDHYDDTFPPLTTEIDTKRIIETYQGMVERLGLRKKIEI